MNNNKKKEALIVQTSEHCFEKKSLIWEFSQSDWEKNCNVIWSISSIIFNLLIDYFLLFVFMLFVPTDKNNNNNQALFSAHWSVVEKQPVSHWEWICLADVEISPLRFYMDLWVFQAEGYQFYVRCDTVLCSVSRSARATIRGWRLREI